MFSVVDLVATPLCEFKDLIFHLKCLLLSRNMYTDQRARLLKVKSKEVSKMSLML